MPCLVLKESVCEESLLCMHCIPSAAQAPAPAACCQRWPAPHFTMHVRHFTGPTQRHIHSDEVLVGHVEEDHRFAVMMHPADGAPGGWASSRSTLQAQIKHAVVMNSVRRNGRTVQAVLTCRSSAACTLMHQQQNQLQSPPCSARRRRSFQSPSVAGWWFCAPPFHASLAYSWSSAVN